MSEWKFQLSICYLQLHLRSGDCAKRKMWGDWPTDHATGSSGLIEEDAILTE